MANAQRYTVSFGQYGRDGRHYLDTPDANRHNAVCSGSCTITAGERVGNAARSLGCLRQEPSGCWRVGAYARRTQERDADGDGLVDLVIRFSAQETGLAAGATQACLVGTASDGTNIQGCAPVRVTGNR